MKIVITGVDDAGKSTAVEIRETAEDADAWKAPIAHIPDWIVGDAKLMSFEPDPGWVKSFAVSVQPTSRDENSANAAQSAKSRLLHDAHTAGLHKTLTCEVVFPFDPVVLILETGEIALEAGDMVVMRGVLHDWRTPTDRPARVGGVSWAVRRGATSATA